MSVTCWKEACAAPAIRSSINAQLIDTQNGAHLWAERFDASRQDLGDTQTTIVRHIASALNFTLVQIEGRRSLQDRPDDPDAVDLFFPSSLTIGERKQSRDTPPLPRLCSRNLWSFNLILWMQPLNLAWLLLNKVTYFDDPSDA